MTTDSPAAPREEEADLATRFRQGDAEALAELYLRHFPSVYRTVGPRGGDPASAEDLAQAAFLRAWEHRERLSDPRKFRPWLLATARNLAIDHRRQRRRQVADEVDDETPTEAPGVDALVAAAESPELLWKAVSSLQPRQREVLQMTVREELSTPEVAVALGVSSAHAAVLIHRSRRALGAAVRSLLVATRGRHCPRLERLIPPNLQVLTGAQRATVDRHMRRCPTCRATADGLTEPARLFAAWPLVALPPSWDTSGLQAVLAKAGAAGAVAHRVIPHGWSATSATGAAIGTVGVAVAAVLLLTAHHPQAPHRPAGSPALAAPLPVPAAAGRIVITGDDPDVHARSGPNAAGAQHVLQAAIRFVTRGRTAPHLLLVTDLRDPGGPLHGDSRLGLAAAGYACDVADHGSATAGVLDLHTVSFTAYDAVVVASDFGGWLRQDELDVLDARRGDLAAYLAGGGGLVAFAEGGAAGVPGSPPLTSHGWFGFLPAASPVAPLSEYEAGVSVTGAGSALGLAATDEARNYLHAAFVPPAGATVLVSDAAGRAITFSMTMPAAAAQAATSVSPTPS